MKYKKTIVTIGKPKTSYIIEGIENYNKRLNFFGKCQLLYLKEKHVMKKKTMMQTLEFESKEILKKIGKRSKLWVLDRKGSPWNSHRWAFELKKTTERNNHDLILVIGGYGGVHPSVINKSNKCISLGSITLPRELAILVTLEQLYRAHTILEGFPYHK